jgi:hypothetical protein
MKRIRIIGLALVAVCAISAVGVSSASAASEKGPHWWIKECVPVEKGKFLDSHCKEAGAGKWELREYKLLPGEKIPFTSKSGKGKFKTSLVSVECEKDKDTGELIGGWPGKDEAEVTFEECHVEGKATCKVSTAGAVNTETIVIKGVKTELVYVGTQAQAEKQEEPVGDLLTIPSTELKFKEGTSSCSVGTATVSGTVVGTPAKNEPLATQTLQFKSPNIKTAWRWNSGGTAVEKIEPELKFKSGIFTVKGEEIGEDEITLTSSNWVAFWIDPT